MSSMMDGPYADTVVSWIADFQRQGRPMMEGRLDRHDLAALQKYAMAGSQRPAHSSGLRSSKTNAQDRLRASSVGTGARSSSRRSCACGAARRVESPRSRRRPDGARAECGPGDPRGSSSRPTRSFGARPLAEDLV